MNLCKCGCGTELPEFGSAGLPRKYVHGHQNKKKIDVVMRPCQCGCGGEIPTKDRKGRSRRFIAGHHCRMGKTEKQNEASRKTLERVRPKVPWNKGRSYVFSRKTEYANKGSWNEAMRRLFPDRCMRCGWSEAACDTHHIQPRSHGGKYTIENGAILCPNCHRLAHCGVVSVSELVSIRATVQQIGIAI